MGDTAALTPARRERLIALCSLLGVAALAWVYLGLGAARMRSGPMASDFLEAVAMAAMPMGQVWSTYWLFFTFLMWTIMMVGMMLPSAAPAILLYGSLVKKNRERGSMLPAAWIFALGYLAVWAGFSLSATLLQAVLQGNGLLSPMMASSSSRLNGLLLVVAGVYQWLPAKDACLEKCRDPLQFLLFRWRPGPTGALWMGAEHGAYCTGCCWAIMLLLFAAGVMNLVWVAVIAAFVLVEKLLPGGRLFGRLAGLALMAGGIFLIIPA
ncbi:MAG: DUF2182 domain-containing protein [Arenicellales bacterium]